MKKLGVEKIEFDFNNNQVVISCNGGKKLNASDSSSGLTPQQHQALNERFKAEKNPITFSQISNELNKEKSVDNKNNGNVGTIVGICVVVGLVLAVVIGVVIHKNKRKDY